MTCLKHGLADVCFKGNSFTWSNGQSGRRLIQERLHKEMANSQWHALFPRALISHLVRETFDPAPIVLDLVGKARSRPKPFRFEAFWTKNNHTKDVLSQAWSWVPCFPTLQQDQKYKRCSMPMPLESFHLWSYPNHASWP